MILSEEALDAIEAQGWLPGSDVALLLADLRELRTRGRWCANVRNASRRPFLVLQGR